MLREFLTEYMPEVDESTALRTLAVMRQGEDESITAYIRQFDLVRSRYVGVALNEEMLRLGISLSKFLRSRQLFVL